MSVEIERKFLVAHVPPEVLAQADGELIRQGYLAVSPSGTEVRLRQRGSRHYLTVKSGGGLIRGEAEVELTAEQAEGLWPAVATTIIEKRRHMVPLAGELLLELDVFDGSLAGLVVAEVEFASVEDGHTFEPPGWLGAEVTDDERYKNRSLALNGLPEGAHAD
jgi:adenylate cyclase